MTPRPAQTRSKRPGDQPALRRPSLDPRNERLWRPSRPDDRALDVRPRDRLFRP